MKFAKVIGNIVATEKMECFKGEKLLLIQPVTKDLINSGDELIATDITSAGPGDIVFYETGREAAIALRNTWNISDATVMGIIDDIHQTI